LGDEWQVAVTNEGRVVVTDTYAHAGSYSLLLDDYRSDGIDSLAAATLNVDLSGQTDVVLEFWGRELSGYPDTADAVLVSEDDGGTWHAIYNLNDLTSSYSRVVIDLDQVVADLGLSLTDHFKIKFQSYDEDPYDGFVIDELQVRSNIDPTLSWCGDAGYETDGLEPEHGNQLATYVYRVSYADADGDPPSGVHVHIKKGGVEIAGSPFTMVCPSGDYVQGVACGHDQVGLAGGSDYTYFFSAEDNLGNAAAPTPELDAPEVVIVTWVHLPLTLKNVAPPAGPPELYPIDNPEGNYEFAVSWGEVERATSYTLEEDTDPGFPAPRTVYRGSSTSRDVRTGDTGTFYYRVRASNSYGTSDWSNVRSTQVTVSPPPCPHGGSWTGLTDEGFEIKFEVADTPRCEVTTLKITTLVQCINPSWSFRYTVTYWGAPEPIVNNEFEYYIVEDPNNHVERVSGTFTSQSQAHGSSFYMVPNPSNPSWFCTGGADWTASYAP
jgi:hypothetical protein